MLTEHDALVEQRDRELLLSILGFAANSSVAERVNKGLAYTYEVEQLARHRTTDAARIDDDLAGAIAYEISKTYVMDVPTARAAIDRARATLRSNSNDR